MSQPDCHSFFGCRGGGGGVFLCGWALSWNMTRQRPFFLTFLSKIVAFTRSQVNDETRDDLVPRFSLCREGLERTQRGWTWAGIIQVVNGLIDTKKKLTNDVQIALIAGYGNDYLKLVTSLPRETRVVHSLIPTWTLKKSLMLSVFRSFIARKWLRIQYTKRSKRTNKRRALLDILCQKGISEIQLKLCTSPKPTQFVFKM